MSLFLFLAASSLFRSAVVTWFLPWSPWTSRITNWMYSNALTLFRKMISLVLLRLFYFGFSDFSCNSCPVNLSFWWLLLGKVCWLHLLTLCPVQGSKALFALPLNSRCAYCKYDCRLFIHSMYFLWFTVSDNHGFYRFDLLTVLCAFFFGLFISSHLRESLVSLLRKCYV